MMAARAALPHLIDQLPRVRGRLTADAPLASHTWFRVGGPAEVLFRPQDAEDLARFMAEKPCDIPVTVIGVGSNLLVRDGGIRGIVVRLGGALARVTVEDDTSVAGAGALDVNVALTALEAGLGGLEFLSGVPGTIGGALRMNAGAYGGEIKDVLQSAEIMDERGVIQVVTPASLGLTYRHCDLPETATFLSARLKGRPETRETIGTRMDAIKTAREDSQPIRTRTGGSTFANPPGAKAWELIDRAGCRGLALGRAMVSEKHCNFLINTGTATAAEIEDLGEEVRRRVRDTSGIDLRWEIRRIGERGP